MRTCQNDDFYEFDVFLTPQGGQAAARTFLIPQGGQARACGNEGFYEFDDFHLPRCSPPGAQPGKSAKHHGIPV